MQSNPDRDNRGSTVEELAIELQTFINASQPERSATLPEQLAHEISELPEHLQDKINLANQLGLNREQCENYQDYVVSVLTEIRLRKMLINEGINIKAQKNRILCLLHDPLIQCSHDLIPIINEQLDVPNEPPAREIQHRRTTRRINRTPSEWMTHEADAFTPNSVKNILEGERIDIVKLEHCIFTAEHFVPVDQAYQASNAEEQRAWLHNFVLPLLTAFSQKDTSYPVQRNGIKQPINDASTIRFMKNIINKHWHELSLEQQNQWINFICKELDMHEAIKNVVDILKPIQDQLSGTQINAIAQRMLQNLPEDSAYTYEVGFCILFLLENNPKIDATTLNQALRYFSQLAIFSADPDAISYFVDLVNYFLASTELTIDTLDAIIPNRNIDFNQLEHWIKITNRAWQYYSEEQKAIVNDYIQGKLLKSEHAAICIGYLAKYASSEMLQDETLSLLSPIKEHIPKADLLTLHKFATLSKRLQWSHEETTPIRDRLQELQSETTFQPYEQKYRLAILIHLNHPDVQETLLEDLASAITNTAHEDRAFWSTGGLYSGYISENWPSWDESQKQTIIESILTYMQNDLNIDHSPFQIFLGKALPLFSAEQKQQVHELLKQKISRDPFKEPAVIAELWEIFSEDERLHHIDYIFLRSNRPYTEQLKAAETILPKLNSDQEKQHLASLLAHPGFQLTPHNDAQRRELLFNVKDYCHLEPATSQFWPAMDHVIASEPASRVSSSLKFFGRKLMLDAALPEYPPTRIQVGTEICTYLYQREREHDRDFIPGSARNKSPKIASAQNMLAIINGEQTHAHEDEIQYDMSNIAEDPSTHNARVRDLRERLEAWHQSSQANTDAPESKSG